MRVDMMDAHILLPGAACQEQRFWHIKPHTSPRQPWLRCKGPANFGQHGAEHVPKPGKLQRACAAGSPNPIASVMLLPSPSQMTCSYLATRHTCSSTAETTCDRAVSMGAYSWRGWSMPCLDVHKPCMISASGKRWEVCLKVHLRRGGSRVPVLLETRGGHPGQPQHLRQPQRLAHHLGRGCVGTGQPALLHSWRHALGHDAG